MTTSIGAQGIRGPGMLHRSVTNRGLFEAVCALLLMIWRGAPVAQVDYAAELFRGGVHEPRAGSGSIRHLRGAARFSCDGFRCAPTIIRVLQELRDRLSGETHRADPADQEMI
jgi:hypothetical protein